MKRFNTICDADVKGKRVIIRTDFNVPVNDLGEITDDSRIIEAAPTIQYVIDHGGKAIILSHLGRPDGESISTLSLAPVAKRLSEILHLDVAFSPETNGPVPEKMTSQE